MINSKQREVLGALASDAMVINEKLRNMVCEITAANLNDSLLENLSIQQQLCSNFYKTVDDLLDK